MFLENQYISEELSATPSEREILEQLARIVISSHFRNSRRYPAMLSYLVHESVAGTGDGLKERVIGIMVFGRRSDYDTNADPIVRVSAGEIRKRLAQYYQGPGQHDPVCFDLPLGSYVPIFRHSHSRPTILGPSPSIAVEQPALSQDDRQSTELKEPDTPLVHGTEIQAGDREQPSTFPSLTPTSASHTISRLRERLLWISLCLVLCIGSALSARSFLRFKASPQSDAQNVALMSFWQPLLKSSQPVRFVLGVHAFDSAGHDLSAVSLANRPASEQTLLSSMTHADMISVSDAISYDRLTNLLAKQSHAYEIQGATDARLTDLSRGPDVLIGGLNNLWTMRLQTPLRYQFFMMDDRISTIRDLQQPGRMWKLNISNKALNTYRDYGIIASFSDEQLKQTVMVVAGIGRKGTEAAAEVLTTNSELQEIFLQMHSHAQKNIEILLYTDVVDDSRGSPHVIDTYAW